MSKKRRGRGGSRGRHRPRPAGGRPAAGSGTAKAAPAGAKATPAAPTATTPAPAGRPSAAAAGLAYPTVGASLWRGFAVVVRSPLLVVTSLLSALAMWAMFAAAGVLLAASPGTMALIQSLVPVHSFFVEVQLVGGAARTDALGTAAAAFGTLAVRALLFGTWTSMLADAFGAERVTAADSLRRGVRRAMASFRAVFAIEAGALVLALVSLFVGLGFLGAGLGQIVIFGGLIASLYYFGFAVLLAVLEGGGAGRILRTSVAAARVPGRQHLLLTLAYLALALFVSALTPGSRVAAATPSILVWGYVLLLGLVHLATLGALVHRWLLVREPLLAAEAKASAAGAGTARPRGGGGRPGSLLGRVMGGRTRP